MDGKPDYQINIEPLQISQALYSIISTVNMPADPMCESRTDLDSHANMPVVGSNSRVIRRVGKEVNVSPFTPDYNSITLPVVDAAILYQCPYTGKEYILLIMNALHVPAMSHNLVPPFIIRDAGVTVRSTPKIQCSDPDETHHALTFDSTFRVPLQLHGIFSYFKTSKPTLEQLETIEEVYMLTPHQFNPHNTAYALNEESMLNWEC